ncbi:MAG: hypothetical protein QNJ31_04315 [Candidatus Caenarcaniphilales bacterium]|nr:hypothetical protein [Candidatus Caenarcaniphilales bacterium]
MPISFCPNERIDFIAEFVMPGVYKLNWTNSPCNRKFKELPLGEYLLRQTGSDIGYTFRIGN